VNIDENVRTMLRGRAESVTATPVVPDRTVRRMQMRKALWAGALVVVAVVGVAGAFLVRSAMSTDAAPQQPAGAPDASETTNEPSPTPTIKDVMKLPGFSPMEPGTYFIDPDDDKSTPLRVVPLVISRLRTEGA
jgi:hypothetical protein